MIPTIEFCIDSLENALLMLVNLAFYLTYIHLSLSYNPSRSQSLKPFGKFRLEICSNLISGGGLTPPMGSVKRIHALLPSTPLMIMIRPRVGSFVYTQSEIETMLAEIEAFREMGEVRGFVFGCLKEDGTVDEVNTRLDTGVPFGLHKKLTCRRLPPLSRLSEVCDGYDVTFHRAFDLTPDPMQAYHTIASIPGINRILTSGQSPKSALDGIDVIRTLIQLSADKTHANRHPITIVPGSGVNRHTLALLRKGLPQATEFHASCSTACTPAGRDASATLEKGEKMGFGLNEWKMDRTRLLDLWEIANVQDNDLEEIAL
ncbi:hypothetical protein IAR55_003945 [Kwoniella newhampshirensis]|uniref:Copper homeostasis protein cutC homolog n=1 Tax=Kwoniella newhampshirensis TaxID=1651941 RepID=A0AAW0YY54_9TREE